MLDRNKKYWLYIEPQVYCCIKNEQMLLYHTQTGAYIESDKKEVVALIEELHKKQNLGVIGIDGKQLTTMPYELFIAEFCEKKMGGLVDNTEEKPIQLMPVLSLQHDVEKLQKDKERFTGEELLHYLLELNVYVNDTCNTQCRLCTNCFRQNLCCTANNGQQHYLSKEILQNILTQIQHSSLGKLNILGGNVLQYVYYDELVSILQLLKERVHLWIHYLNVNSAETLFPGFKYEIPVTFPVNELAFAACLNRLGNEQTTCHFFITSEEDYNQARCLFDTHVVPNYRLYPTYTGENSCFFEEQVFITKQDVFSTPLSFRQIFAHQKLNTNFFGSLTIMPDGDVYPNVNNPAIGNIKSDSILDLIDKEIQMNTSWRKIRDEKPCVSCLYQYLCPSPSDYELVIGKPNLCHVKP